MGEVPSLSAVSAEIVYTLDPVVKRTSSVTASVILHWSPFAWCSVCNDPIITITLGSEETEHTAESKGINSHAQDTTEYRPVVFFLTGIHRLLFEHG